MERAYGSYRGLPPSRLPLDTAPNRIGQEQQTHTHRQKAHGPPSPAMTRQAEKHTTAARPTFPGPRRRRHGPRSALAVHSPRTVHVMTIYTSPSPIHPFLLFFFFLFFHVQYVTRGLISFLSFLVFSCIFSIVFCYFGERDKKRTEKVLYIAPPLTPPSSVLLLTGITIFPSPPLPSLLPSCPFLSLWCDSSTSPF